MGLFAAGHSQVCSSLNLSGYTALIHWLFYFFCNLALCGCLRRTGGEEMLWSNGEAKDVSDVVSSLRATSNGEMLLAGTDAGKVCVWRVKYNR